ncbi:hypothetical protein BDV96DRAFT_646443 [Lophiotrema nucula]|uniref:Rhodopsin domain-containing protein n=1 Tax=Lophiotrema nucula TaxID=690887 RepID=A0A6A5Z9M1_9PLEO|nr:hypothetical protein BDV96DRAFT_646443 [Lophiotrema nucula]
MSGDFAHITLTTIAQWPKPRRNPITRGWLPPVSITLTAVTSLVLATRLWSLRKTAHGLFLDDALAIVAWLFILVFTAACMAGSLRFGFNRHIWDVSAELYDGAALIEWLSEFAFLVSMCLTKMSVLVFYRRLDHPCPKPLRRIISIFIALTLVYTLAFILTQILLCRPTNAYWIIPRKSDKTTWERSCASQHITYPLQGSLDVFSTFYTIMIPVLVLRNIPMAATQRRGLGGTALFGLVIFGIGVTRTAFLSHLADSPNGDATWNSFSVLACALFECHLSLICASVPFMQRYLPHYRNTRVVFVIPESKARNDSVMSRVSSSVSGQIKRSFKRSNSPREMDISGPQAVEIPEWEFQSLESPRTGPQRSPLDIISYERYLAGNYGPAPPPKDSRELFDQYRRAHGEIV